MRLPFPSNSSHFFSSVSCPYPRIPRKASACLKAGSSVEEALEFRSTFKAWLGAWRQTARSKKSAALSGHAGVFSFRILSTLRYPEFHSADFKTGGPNFSRLALGCIDADLRDQKLIGKRSPSYTKSAVFSMSQISKCQSNNIKNPSNFARFSEILWN